MFASRRRRKLTAEESEYISKRYEDPAIRIYQEVKQQRCLYSSYVPWIQAMLIQYIPDAVLREKYWMEQVPLLTERTKQIVTDRSEEKKAKRKYRRKRSEKSDLKLEETDTNQEQIVTIVAINHRHSSLLEPVRLAWREEDTEESQTSNIITNSHRKSRSQVHETRSRFCTIS